MTLFTTPEAADKAAEYLANERKKFEKDGQIDVEALLKSKAEASWHIDNIQNENGTLRGELDKRITYEELMAKITPASRVTSSASDQDADEQSESLPNVNVDIEKVVAQKVSEQLNQYQQKSVQDQNTIMVVQELKKSWGDNYVTKLREVGKELGMSEERMQLLAANEPKAFLRMVNPTMPNAQVPGYTPPSSSVRADGKSATMNYAYFEALRKASPRKELTQEQTALMWKLAAEKGADFYK